MEESDVKGTCGGLRRIVQNLLRREIFNSKSDALKKVDSNSDKMKKNLIEKLTRRKFFIQKHAFYKRFFIQNHSFWKKLLFRFMLFRKTFSFKIVLLKCARKAQSLGVLRGKLKQNVIFCVQIFLKIVLFKNIFLFKIVLFKIYSSSKLCFLKIFFSPKSDAW